MLYNKQTFLALAVASALSANASAAGYKLYEQSTSAMGNAYAGRGAQVEDATVGFTNPAALIWLEGSQVSGGLNLIKVDGEYDNARGFSANGQPVAGPTGDDVDRLSAIPHFHYYRPLNERLGFGLSLAAPFGVRNDYEADFVGRYFAQNTELSVLALQPSISYKVNDRFSVGLGIAFNHVEGELSKFKDHKGLCELGAGINGTYAQLTGGAFTDVAQPAYCDSFYKVAGDDSQFGYTLGLYYHLSEQTRLALSYHSSVSYTLTGDSEIDNTPVTGASVPFTANPEQYLVMPTIPGVVDGQAMPAIDLSTGKLAVGAPKTEASKLDLTTPQSVLLSIDHQVDEQLSLQASLHWTDWSEFTDITVKSREPGPISASTQQPDNLNQVGYIGYIPEYWRDTWSYAIGASYRYSERWAFKAGLARDNSPVAASYRSARIPTDDRNWLTLGAKYSPDSHWSFDFAWGLMIMDDTSVVDHEFNAQDLKLYHSSYSADYEINAYVLSAQANYRF